MELCDNAIAASLPGEKGLIFIGLAPGSSKDELLLVVADWGSGMDLSQLETPAARQSAHRQQPPQRAWVRHQQRPGQPDRRRPPLGLYTRGRGAAGYLKVQGPFTPQMTVEEVDTPAPAAGAHSPPGSSRHRLLHPCSRWPLPSRCRTGRQGHDLETLRSWLVENLGVAYRGFLDLDSRTMESSAKIIAAVGSDAKLVPPIPVPIAGALVRRFTVEMGGQVIPVVYRYGALDEDKRDHLVLGAKAKYYYQGNQPTQGVDIRLASGSSPPPSCPKSGGVPTGCPWRGTTTTTNLWAKCCCPNCPGAC